jgi:hypothetical protein
VQGEKWKSKMDEIIPKVSVPAQLETKTPAEYAYESLAQQIKEFEAQTKDEEVVGAMLASFGQSVVIHIRQVRLCGQMICMEGVTDGGGPATLVQHFTQASILLLRVPKAPAEIKRPIGFLS